MFKELGLKGEILHALSDAGYLEPTEVQKEAIKQLLSSAKDLIVKSHTGSGKTAAFALPIIQQIDANNPKIQCLILCPTRELAIQIDQEIEKYSKYLPKVKSSVVYGGTAINKQIEELQKPVHIVTGTPGRVLDLIERKKLKVYKSRFLVLDEADKMLGMGFKEDIELVFSKIYKTRQTLLFSATMPSDVKEMIKKHLIKPVKIDIEDKEDSGPDIKHSYYVVEIKEKHLILKYILLSNPKAYGIIFCRTKQKAKELAQKLKPFNSSLGALQGDMSQNQRNLVMAKFKKKEIRILVATDVAGRGIDVDDLNLIVNYDLPDSAESYLHRAGRTGRIGKAGECVSIITEKEKKYLEKVAVKFNLEFQEIFVGEDKPKTQLELAPKKESGTKPVKNRFFINIGTKTDLTTEILEDFLVKYLPEKVKIKKIELMKTFSFFETTKTDPKKLINCFKNISYQDIPVIVEPAKVASIIPKVKKKKKKK